MLPIPSAAIALYELATWPRRRRERRLLSQSFRSWILEGEAAVDRGDRTEAERLFRVAIDHLYQRPWLDPDVGFSLEAAEGFARLGEIHGGKGAYALLARAIEDTRSKGLELGRDSPEFAYALVTLDRLYKALRGKFHTFGYNQYGYGHPQQSATTGILDRALNILEHHQAVLSDERTLKVRHAAGYRHAQTASPERVLERRIDAFGRHHPKVAEAMEGLALSHLPDEDSDYRAREEHARLLRDALALREDVQGRWHPEVAESLLHIAHFHDVQDEWQEADDALDRALEILLWASAVDRPEWHDRQDIFEFVLPPPAGVFTRVDRITVTETAAYNTTLATDSAHRERVPLPLTLRDVMDLGAELSLSSSALDRLGEAIHQGYGWIHSAPPLPRECYDLDGILDPLWFGTVPADWPSRFQRFRASVAPHRMARG